MTYYQACCTLVAVILAIAIHTDPVVNFIFTEPLNFLKRLTFAAFYYAVTTPKLVFWFTEKYPMTAIQFYASLMDMFDEIYPEVNDNDDGME